MSVGTWGWCPGRNIDIASESGYFFASLSGKFRYRPVTDVSGFSEGVTEVAAMDEFTAFELSQLYLQTISMAESEFWYWTSITFAVVVAAYVAGQRLGRKIRYVMATLYLLATVHLCFKLAGLIFSADNMSSVLVESGVLTLPSFGPLTFVSRVLVLAVGTLATVYFLLSTGRRTEGGKLE